jgi:hypothetical protein
MFFSFYILNPMSPHSNPRLAAALDCGQEQISRPAPQIHRQPFSIDTVSFDACVADDGLTLTLDHGLAAS